MIVVADAAPLIFLAKLDRLGLIRQLFGTDILVPRLVAEEVLRPPLPPVEEMILQRFLSSVTVVAVSKSRKKASALSQADLAVYQLAIGRKADYVLTDDRLLRALLDAEGLVPQGTLGILMHALQKGILSKNETRRCIDDLVRKYNLRIGIELFERILERLDLI
jgi:predicted nucleic acid-binding protein